MIIGGRGYYDKISYLEFLVSNFEEKENKEKLILINSYFFNIKLTFVLF